MEVIFQPTFLRMLKTLPESLQEEVIEKVELFRNPINHKLLKVHKLHGALRGRHSFSVNYKVRVVFYFTGKTPKEAYLLAVGDHDIYA